ncbi:MAG: tRNA lysidine(34) synthetase TilS [Clostridia bacterium]|nr:tRNA lysidine(34) synthetase TilS [Clostridia bacterium]
MLQSVLTAIERFSLLSADNITVALSGGADSVALLHALCTLKDKLKINISAAHLNHMIRGDEALRDENFVKQLCGDMNVPLICESIDVPAYAEKNRLSIETAAREVRYAFFERINTGVVATAHTASDNLETVLFNLARGTGLNGLCGIPPKRSIYIRPLILVTRDEVEAYCAENCLSYVTDSTNLSDDYTRNRIRHTVIPVLKSVNPSAEKTVARTVVSVREDEEFLNACADNYLSANFKDGFLTVDSAVPPSVLKRAIKKYAEYIVPDLRLDSLHLNSIYSVSVNGGRTSLPCDCIAEAKNGRLSVKNKLSNGKKTVFNVSTAVKDNTFFKNGEKVNNLLLNNSIDCDKIVGESVLRTRLPGDSVRLAGRGCTKTLKKLMNELKIPNELRDSVPVLADDDGVIWVYGAGTASRCAVNEKTEKVMIITVSDVQNKTDEG